MRLPPSAWLAALVLLAPAAQSASAQFSPAYGPSRPRISPYLNLLRSGGSPALNYYGLVRPQQEFRGDIQGLQTGQFANQQAIQGLQTGQDDPGLPVTSYPVGFQTHRGFFMTGGSAGGGGSTASFTQGAGAGASMTRSSAVGGASRAGGAAPRASGAVPRTGGRR